MNEYLEKAGINISTGVIGGSIVILFTDIEKFNYWLIFVIIICSLIIPFSYYLGKKSATKNLISNSETKKEIEKWKNYF